MEKKMQCAVLQLGPLGANCSIIWDEKNNAVVADPGGNADRIMAVAEEKNLSVKAILLTHGHYDHIGGVEQLREKTGAPLYIHSDDAYRLEKPADVLLKDGDTIQVGELRFNVLHTPGHTEGSVCYICEDLMLSGDTLFRESIGRTDLEGGDTALIYESLANIVALPGNYTVVPGHGMFTTLEYERELNPYLS